MPIFHVYRYNTGDSPGTEKAATHEQAAERYAKRKGISVGSLYVVAREHVRVFTIEPAIRVKEVNR